MSYGFISLEVFFRFIRDLLGSDELEQGWGQEEFLDKAA